MRSCCKLRLLLVAAVSLMAAAVFAQRGTIELTSFPMMGAADGRSPITVNATFRDQSGNLVPNGTRILFDTNLGEFREAAVETENGFAVATLIAPSIPGIAKVRATSLQYGASTTIEVEFVRDRSLLDSAKEFIEITAPSTLTYSIQDRIIEATGEEQTVVVRYRDIEIRADDLQLRVPTYEVKARNAVLKIGDFEHEFEQLFFRLNRRRGQGMTTHMADLIEPVRSGYLVAGKKVTRERFGPVAITSQGVSVYEGFLDSRLFKFQSIINSLSSVDAKKAVAFPRKEVHFHKSNVKIGGISVMKLPLFQVSTVNASPLITEQYFNVSNNQVAINYPYYLSLKPGETTLLRFRMGNRYGATTGASKGVYLDYEYNWNQGDNMQGGLALKGINRNDWGARFRQFLQPDPSTTISAQVDFPAHRSLYSSVSASKAFDGFHVNLSGSHGRSLGDQTRFQNNRTRLVIEKDPIKMGSFPARLHLGVNAQSNSFKSATTSRSQEGYGIHARMSSNPLRLSRQHALMASYKVSKFNSSDNDQDLMHYGAISLSSNLSPGFVLQTSYDYVHDGFNSDVLGQHRVTAETFFTKDKISIRGFAAKSLDIDRLNTSASLNYELSPLWRFYYSWYADRYVGDVWQDQTVILGYRLGFREIGLSYSTQRNRIGLELLGTRF